MNKMGEKKKKKRKKQNKQNKKKKKKKTTTKNRNDLNFDIVKFLFWIAMSFVLHPLVSQLIRFAYQDLNNQNKKINC